MCVCVWSERERATLYSFVRKNTRETKKEVTLVLILCNQMEVSLAISQRV